MKKHFLMLIIVLSQLSVTIACGGTGKETAFVALDSEADPNGVLTGRTDLDMEISTDPDMVQYYRIYFKDWACSNEYNGCSQGDIDTLIKQYNNLCGENADGRDCYYNILSKLNGESLELGIYYVNSLQTEVSYPLEGRDPPFSFQYYNRTGATNLSCGRELNDCGTTSLVLHKIPSIKGDVVSLDFTIRNASNEVIVSISIVETVDLSFTPKQCVSGDWCY